MVYRWPNTLLYGLSLVLRAPFSLMLLIFWSTYGNSRVSPKEWKEHTKKYSKSLLLFFACFYCLRVKWAAPRTMFDQDLRLQVNKHFVVLSLSSVLGCECITCNLSSPPYGLIVLSWRLLLSHNAPVMKMAACTHFAVFHAWLSVDRCYFFCIHAAFDFGKNLLNQTRSDTT